MHFASGIKNDWQELETVLCTNVLVASSSSSSSTYFLVLYTSYIHRSAINLAKNGISNSEKTRHVSIRFFLLLTDRIKSGEIKLQHLGTEDMIADLLTKPSQGERFARLRDFLLGYTSL